MDPGAPSFMPTGIDHGLLVQALNQPVSASSLVKENVNSVTPRDKRISNGPGPSPADKYPEDSPVHLRRLVPPPRRLPTTGINVNDSEDFPSLGEAARQPRRSARSIPAAPGMHSSPAVPTGLEATQAYPQQMAQRPDAQRVPTSLATPGASQPQQQPQTPHQRPQGSPFPGSGSARNLTYDFNRLAASQQAQRQATAAQLHSVFFNPQASSQGRATPPQGPASMSGPGSAQSTAARGSLTQPPRAPQGLSANLSAVHLARQSTLGAIPEYPGHSTQHGTSTARLGMGFSQAASDLGLSQPTAFGGFRPVPAASARGDASSTPPNAGVSASRATSNPQDNLFQRGTAAAPESHPFQGDNSTALHSTGSSQSPTPRANCNPQGHSVQGAAATALPSMGFFQSNTPTANRSLQGNPVQGDASTALPGMSFSRPSAFGASPTMRGFPTQSNVNFQGSFSFPPTFAPQPDPAVVLRGLGASQATGPGTQSTTPRRPRRVPRPIYVVAPPQQSDALLTNPYPSHPSDAAPPTTPFPPTPAPQAVNPDLAAYLASAGLSTLPTQPTHEGYDNPTDFMPLIPFYPSTSSPPSPTRPPVNPDPTAPFNPAQDMYTTPPMSPLSHRDAFLRPRTPDPLEPDGHPLTQGQLDGRQYGLEIGGLGCSALGTSDRMAWMGERRGRNDRAGAGPTSGWNPPDQERRVESLAGGFEVPARRGDGWGGWEDAMRRREQ